MKFIIIVTMSLWDEPHRGRHHYALALSQCHRVLWVNRRIGWREGRIAKKGLEVINNGLQVLHTGRSLLPGRVDERLNVDNLVRLSMLKEILPSMGKPDIIWIYDYKATNFAKSFSSDAVTVYFCNDYHGEYAFHKHERFLAWSVDHVFATAPGLVDRLKPFNEKAYFVPHGHSFSRFGGEYKPVNEERIGKFGYFGTLRNQIDTDVLFRLVEETDWKLVLAGPIVECDKRKESEFYRLFKHPHVIYLGNLGSFEVSEHLSDVDILILPYLKTKESAYMFPIKYFEYLSTGQPIVATDFFHFPKPYDSFIYVLKRGKRIKEMISLIASAWNNEKSRNAIDLAMRSTWQERISTISKITHCRLD